jgi:selenocysteine lyase/cysteine desulfurase
MSQIAVTAAGVPHHLESAARAARWQLDELSGALIGRDCPAPLRDGSAPYINLDSAATTPALGSVKRAVDRALPYYGAVHRGTGFKAELSTELYQRCRKEVLAFVGADASHHVVIFGRSTTELINVLAHSLGLRAGDTVLVTGLEHHSNDLPWRRAARVVRVEADAHGGLSEDAIEACLRRHDGKVKLLAVTGASNVTGYMPDIGLLADLAHRYGAKIFVDAAQLAGHRALRMADRARELDFVAFSGHKMYAPFGSGALVGPREAFERKAPFVSGGGTVSLVTSEDVWWADAPYRQEAGTPNLLGAVAMAQACRALARVTLNAIADYERVLCSRALRQLGRIPGLTLYGDSDPELRRDRVGIIPFNIKGIEHAAVAETLSLRYGIGVRSGCFCAQPLLTRLLGQPELSSMGAAALAARMKSDANAPGMVRVSLGLCNTEADVDALCDAVAAIAADPSGSQALEQERDQRRRASRSFVEDVFVE